MLLSYTSIAPLFGPENYFAADIAPPTPPACRVNETNERSCRTTLGLWKMCNGRWNRFDFAVAFTSVAELIITYVFSDAVSDAPT